MGKRSSDGERSGVGGKRGNRATFIDDEAFDSDDEGAEESEHEVENAYDREFINNLAEDDDNTDLHRRLDAERVE